MATPRVGIGFLFYVGAPKGQLVCIKDSILLQNQKEDPEGEQEEGSRNYLAWRILLHCFQSQ